MISAQQGRLSWHHEGRSGTITPEDLWRRVGRAQLFVLDEIGARDRVSDFHYETVQRVLDDRMNKPTVCISNLPLAKVADLYDDRIASRLGAGLVRVLEGKDRRINR